MKIAVDAMGGDHAPDEIIKGVFQAAQENSDISFYLVGKESLLQEKVGDLPDNIEIRNADDVIGMDESVEVLRKRREASIWVATQMVKNKEADAVISAGSTGAQMASALLQFGRIKGISRPAIMILYPTLKGPKLLLDVGATTDVTADQLVQFAKMGRSYAENVLHMKSPKTALLSNGSEAKKGSDSVVEAHIVLKKDFTDFIGNIEGRDLPFGNYDVAVCNGFAGNIVLKLSEGLFAASKEMIRDVVRKSFGAKIGALFLKPALKSLSRDMDYRERGGAPLLGVQGISIICHGSSDARAIRNSIRVAEECVMSQFVQKIENECKEKDE